MPYTERNDYFFQRATNLYSPLLRSITGIAVDVARVYFYLSTLCKILRESFLQLLYSTQLNFAIIPVFFLFRFTWLQSERNDKEYLEYRLKRKKKHSQGAKEERIK